MHEAVRVFFTWVSKQETSRSWELSCTHSRCSPGASRGRPRPSGPLGGVWEGPTSLRWFTCISLSSWLPQQVGGWGGEVGRPLPLGLCPSLAPSRGGHSQGLGGHGEAGGEAGWEAAGRLVGSPWGGWLGGLWGGRGEAGEEAVGRPWRERPPLKETVGVGGGQ